MKVFMVSVCALLATASAGSVAWPGAVTSSSSQSVYNPRHGKSYGFASTQYFNTIPSTVPFTFQPQLTYQVQHLNPYAPVHHGVYHVPGSPIFPSNLLYPSFPGLAGPPTHVIPGYPAQPIAPILPSYPVQGVPSQPSNGGDSDTTVVDSADFPNQGQEQQSQEQQSQEQQSQEQQSQEQQSQEQQSQEQQSQEQQTSTEAPQEEKPSNPQPDQPSFPPQLPPNFPIYPSFPQIPQGQAPSFPLFPQYPQGGVQLPSFPSIQFPQGSLPTYPQIPQFPPSQPNFPQFPSAAPPASYPGQSNGDKGLNDEDTVSIESA